jgi:hypothetical protein
LDEDKISYTNHILRDIHDRKWVARTKDSDKMGVGKAFRAFACMLEGGGGGWTDWRNGRKETWNRQGGWKIRATSIRWMPTTGKNKNIASEHCCGYWEFHIQVDSKAVIMMDPKYL